MTHIAKFSEPRQWVLPTSTRLQ